MSAQRRQEFIARKNVRATHNAYQHMPATTGSRKAAGNYKRRDGDDKRRNGDDEEEFRWLAIEDDSLDVSTPRLWAKDQPTPQAVAIAKYRQEMMALFVNASGSACDLSLKDLVKKSCSETGPCCMDARVSQKAIMRDDDEDCNEKYSFSKCMGGLLRLLPSRGSNGKRSSSKCWDK